jgi:gamma-glutamyltranspeptidase/glutathione hydrolase
MGSETLEAGKSQANSEPATSTTPTIVFDGQGRSVVVGGSAGGGEIVDYVARSRIEMFARDASTK